MESTVLYFIGAVLDISPKATVAQVGMMVVSRCFARCLTEAVVTAAATAVVLRNNASDVWWTDAFAERPGRCPISDLN